MIRRSLSDYNFPKYDDEDVIRSWNYFKSFISDEDWAKRKTDIENKITMEFRETPPFSEPLTEGTLLAIKDNDVIGWYLYLVYILINEPHKYEFFQGARVVPIFKRFGTDLELLQTIDGIENRIRSLVKKRRAEADALLFEILTALLWARNGYSVSFLDEKAVGTTPDIMVKKGNKVLNIECKRQTKTSDYTYNETAKRQKMIRYVSEALIQKNILLDLVFHVELHTLPDTFLLDLLEDKLKSPRAGKVISNEIIDVSLSFIDISSIRAHLKKFVVKNHSPMLNQLIGGKPVDGQAFTSAIYGSYFRMGEGNVNNLYIDDIASAFGVFWKCDAEEAIWAKARDVKNQIQKAMKQFSSEITSVIHIGIETYDGPEVERKRFEKILGTIDKINPEESQLRWIFCNFFQGYSPPDRDWFFDETSSTITAYFVPIVPIEIRFMVIPEDESALDDLSHWDRPLPY